jgi:hypothetical protein
VAWEKPVMKKIYLLILISCSVFAVAQRTTSIPKKNNSETSSPREVKPPDVIVERFNKEHPGVTPTWRMDGKNYVADFVDANTLKGMTIVYDAEGKVIRRESEVENSSYPQVINDYYIKHYPGEKYRTWTSQDEKGERRYFIKRDRNTLWFDKEGKIVEPLKN